MKKLISLLLTIVILFTCTIFSAYAEEETPKAPTLEELEAQELAQTNEMVDTIFALDIIERNSDGLMGLSEKATRMDVVIWLYRMFNYDRMDTVPQASHTYFEDIDIHHYAAGYIEYMVSIGVVSGYDDSTFRPENVITYDEIRTLLIRALRYKNEASLNLKVSVSEDDMDGITKKTAAEMLYKLMFTEMFPMLGGTEYNNSDKEEFIRYIMKLDYFDGVLDGVGGVSLYNKTISKKVISVGGNEYLTSYDFSDEYLGYHGRCYIDTRSDDEVILFYPSRKNEILEITSDQLESYQSREYTYYTENDKLKRAKLLKGFDCVYNGYYNEDTSLMVPEYGNVKLISNDNDNEYDVVIIEDIKSYVVDRVINDREIVFKNLDENGANIMLDIEKLDECEIYLESGSITTISAVKSGSVVNVLSNSANQAKLFVSNKKITGQLSAISEEDGYLHMTVDGISYKTVPGMYKDIWDGTSFININLLLDVNGRVAGVSVVSAEGWQYGYILKVVHYDELRETVRLKLLKEDGKIESINCAEKVVLNGERIKSPLEVYNRINNAYLNFNDYTEIVDSGQPSEIKENFTTRLIRFFLNNDGEISKLDTPVKHSLYDESNSITDNEDVLAIKSKGNLYYAPNQSMMKVVWKTDMDIFGDVVLNSGARIFVIPTSDNDNPDEDDYSVYTGLKNIGFDQYGEFCYASAYNTNPESLGCDVMVIRKSAGSSAGKTMAIFDSIYQLYDEKEGEVINVIKYMSKGQMQEQKLDNGKMSVDISTLKKGDIILYSLKNGELVLEDLLYNSSGTGILNSSNVWPLTGAQHFNIDYRVLVGKVARTDGDIIHVKIENETLFDELVKTSNISVYDISIGKNGDVFKSKPSELRTLENNPGDADTVLVSSKNGAIQEVIVVRY